MTLTKNYGFEFMTYGLLVAGRLHEYGITLGQARRMAQVAKSWSSRAGSELACVPSLDLSESGAWSNDGDDTDDTQYIAGIVVAAVSADDGPSRPLQLAQLADAVKRSEQLPAGLWEELTAASGGAAFKRPEHALYLVSCGPLCAAKLGFGVLGDAPTGNDGAWVVGKNFSQERHARGVRGLEVARVGMEARDLVSPIDLDAASHAKRVDTAPSGAYHLIAAYD